MKMIINILAIFAIIGLLSTLICGLWIHKQPSIDPSSIKFHMQIGIGSIILSVLTLILLMIRK